MCNFQLFSVIAYGAERLLLLLLLLFFCIYVNIDVESRTKNINIQTPRNSNFAYVVIVRIRNVDRNFQSIPKAFLYHRILLNDANRKNIIYTQHTNTHYTADKTKQRKRVCDI